MPLQSPFPRFTFWSWLLNLFRREEPEWQSVTLGRVSVMRAPEVHSDSETPHVVVLAHEPYDDDTTTWSEEEEA